LNPKLKLLFDIADAEHITINYYPLDKPTFGVYYSSKETGPIIGISTKIENDEDQLMLVLAEELGHHFTSVGESVGPYYHHADRVNLDKVEEAALRWACDTLVPTEELISCIKNSTDTLHDVSKRLHVSKKILHEKLRFLSLQHSFIQINDNLALVLSGFPNICLYKPLQ